MVIGCFWDCHLRVLQRSLRFRGIQKGTHSFQSFHDARMKKRPKQNVPPSESRLLEHGPLTWKSTEMSTDKPKFSVRKDRLQKRKNSVHLH